MSRTSRSLGVALLVGAIALIAGGARVLMSAAIDLPTARAAIIKSQQAGNFRDAYEGFRKLLADPENRGPAAVEDFQNAIACLNQLQRQKDVDGFRDEVLKAHPDDWQLLAAAGQSLVTNDHNGFLIAGKFIRGYQNRDGQYVNAADRDRVLALQLFQRAQPLVDDAKKLDAANFYLTFASAWTDGRAQGNSWRLNALTEIPDAEHPSAIPDYDPTGWNAHQFGGGKGVPVDTAGNPIFYALSAALKDARNDGERWRWCLHRAAELAPEAVGEQTEWEWAQFLQQQFSVTTLLEHGIQLPRGGDDAAAKSVFALQTLTDEETITHLATGVKRLKLPAEHNPLEVLKKLAARGKALPYGASAAEQIAQIYEDRQQYPRAAEQWRAIIREFGPGEPQSRTARLDQIVKPWGRFEGGVAQPAGTGAPLEYRFRNGTQVHFTAQRIKVEELLTDLRTYLKSAPTQLDWQKLQLDNIGWRIVEGNEAKYVGAQVAAWDLKLQPRPAHFDRQITVATPLQEAGAYMVTAQMENGNKHQVVLWVDNTVIARKSLGSRSYYFVGDAVTGKPLEKVNVEFIGWTQQYDDKAKVHRLLFKNFAEVSDANGQILPDPKLFEQNYQWLSIARDKATNRLAHLGFSHLWYGNPGEPVFDLAKSYLITDRPVYRPEQTVKFKMWVRRAKYDLTAADEKQFAGKAYSVRLNDPQGTEVWTKPFTTDEFGGLDGEYALPKEAKLGVYQLHIIDVPLAATGGSFRVEEYKKPEFEVTVVSPEKPVALGEPITATIKAKYYFGTPVTQAKVKYKVHRSPHTDRWYPQARWDWLYGSGYWWFAPECNWYKGFGRWGCFAPYPMWWGGDHAPPELVIDAEAAIGADGTLPITIDTALAKALHGDEDHAYTITAEVVDESRRTIVGTGRVIVAREPFKVFAWTDRGHYLTGDTIRASFQARTPDGKPVAGTGKVTLYRITYDAKAEPQEAAVQNWELAPDVEGRVEQVLKASAVGQYRLSYQLTDAAGHAQEGGYLFNVIGAGFDGSQFRFNDLELITDQREYQPGDKVKLLINTNRTSSTVLLFIRPRDGVATNPPQVLRLTGKSTMQEIPVVAGDMPNFFVEAVTVANGRVHNVAREVIVPPAQRVINVEVTPSARKYTPGQEATVSLKLTDHTGEPMRGTVALTMYDKSVEYIAGGSNVPEIRQFFWKWRRNHHPSVEHNLSRALQPLVKSGLLMMNDLGAFGHFGAELEGAVDNVTSFSAEALGAPRGVGGRGDQFHRMSGNMLAKGMLAPAAAPETRAAADKRSFAGDAAGGSDAGGGPDLPEPTVRSQFADTAVWNGNLLVDKDGLGSVTLKMPENLTGWKFRAWGLGEGTRVGEGTVEVVTTKNILVRLQTPRFLVEKDEVTISANVHNEFDQAHEVTISVELGGDAVLQAIEDGAKPFKVTIPAHSEKRADWRFVVVKAGEVAVTAKAVSAVESDAMQLKFPARVHGILKTDSYSGVVRIEDASGQLDITVPQERRPAESRLEVRYSPTLAGAMVDALPYLVDYPYGCTEQTLNRFLPTVITQNILKRMKLDLAAIRDQRTNLNAQEIGDDQERAKRWKRFDRNPVFDEAEVASMVKKGVADLTAMQCSDGGWGWFSGWGEHSAPHTTAVVVHGLQIAKSNGVGIVPDVLERGVAWMKRYQSEQVALLQEGERHEKDPSRKQRFKSQADDLDAMTYMILLDADMTDAEMQRFLYRDRTKLSLYSAAMFGLALHKQKSFEQRDMIVKNIDQFVVSDAENQTTYIDLPNHGNYWWSWYGNTIEANAYFLKLLTAIDPHDPRASGLVKYLLNNRKHGSYWNNTRDTAICIEALAEYLVASGEDRPQMVVEVWLDGELKQSVEITPEVLFTFNNQFVLTGEAVTAGPHKIELRKKPLDPKVAVKSPLYFNAYLTNFTLEDPITAAGLEVKVERQFYKLTQRQEATDLVEGARGEAIRQKSDTFDRTLLANLTEVKSGDLIEVELKIDSKNDYEYLLFEDHKAAGLEPTDVRSGYTANGLGAYVEYRDERVVFFIRQLARGPHSVSYRLRAEFPGQFSALPTKGSAMYAPELRANSHEYKLRIRD